MKKSNILYISMIALLTVFFILPFDTFAKDQQSLTLSEENIKPGITSTTDNTNKLKNPRFDFFSISILIDDLIVIKKKIVTHILVDEEPKKYD